MPEHLIDKLSRANGISLTYTDAMGTRHRTSDAAKRGLLAALGASIDGADGDQSPSFGARRTRVARTKSVAMHAFLPAWLEKGRAWGVTCQLYSIRSARNGGIGDFEDLARLAELLGAQGADFLGINPIHALFFSDPGRYSPYSPSSRRFLTPIYIATDLLDGAESDRGSNGSSSSHGKLIDYAEVLSRKRRALETAFAHFERTDLGTGSPQDIDFKGYRELRGGTLEEFATFEALSEHLMARGCGSGWLDWPPEFRSIAGPSVAAFKREHAGRIQFHTWLQWIAERQLADAQRRAVSAGMRVGLYLDIAVGVAPDGVDTWCAPDEVLATARIGAPPDAFNVLGQDWGLAPISPRALSEGKSSTFASVIACATRHAGAVRLDHALSLTRLYLIPKGHRTTDGAYVAYPLSELLDIISDVSDKHRVTIIGEDLGTVPRGFRETIRARGIQGYRVLIFERTEAGFRPPRDYDRSALACIGTHDLPTFAAWWRGSDIDDRQRLGILSAEEAASARASRMTERAEIVSLLATEGLLSSGRSPSQPEAIAVPIHELLARTPCRLAAVQLEDLVGFEGCMNIPGTIDEHPNWRQRLPTALEEISDLPQFVSICAAMRRERPRTP
jgi:4-alpha-glucanotransferase